MDEEVAKAIERKEIGSSKQKVKKESRETEHGLVMRLLLVMRLVMREIGTVTEKTNITSGGSISEFSANITPKMEDYDVCVRVYVIGDQISSPRQPSSFFYLSFFLVLLTIQDDS